MDHDDFLESEIDTPLPRTQNRRHGAVYTNINN